ncbi:hypothetical protein [Halosimplex amylolyticum]|uniref:hypothetical protein n=1 Tax=Halosimplex amylolyticum TaxID=3396616 RepID=UPI003F550958
MPDDEIKDTASEEQAGTVLDLLQGYNRYARELRENGQLAPAGEYYVAGARGRLMRSWPLPDGASENVQPSPTYSISQFTYGMRELLLGSLCFRLAGSSDRCRNHSEQGCLIVSDLIRGKELEAEPELGLCHEILGDLRVVGEIENADEAYETAAEFYSGTDSHLGWQMEDGFDDFSLLVTDLADSAGYTISTETREEVTRTSLDARIRFKRNHFAKIIDTVLAAGNWESKVL